MYLKQAFKFTPYLLICSGDNFIFIRSVGTDIVKLLLGEGKNPGIIVLNGNATLLSTSTEKKWERVDDLEMETGKNLRLGGGTGRWKAGACSSH